MTAASRQNAGSRLLHCGLFVAAIVTAFLPAGCEHAPAQPPAANQAPKRIISAAPTVTEILCELGLRDRMVGRTDYCTYPPDVQSVRSIGSLTDVNAEVILSLKPDLILMSGNSQTQRDRLEPLGLRLESVPDTSLADIYAAVRRIGELTHRDKAAEALCRRMEQQIAATDDKYRGAPSRRVLLLIDTLADPPRPPTVAGSGSFYDDLLKRAGHKNVSAGVTAAFGQLSLEAIVHADPDVIIELDPDGTARPNGDADAERVWSKIDGLAAVREHRVHVLTGPVYYLPGPRVPKIYADLCEAIARE